MDSIKICLCLMCNVEWRQDNAMEDHGMENVIIGVAEESCGLRIATLPVFAVSSGHLPHPVSLAVYFKVTTHYDNKLMGTIQLLFCDNLFREG